MSGFLIVATLSWTQNHDVSFSPTEEEIHMLTGKANTMKSSIALGKCHEDLVKVVDNYYRGSFDLRANKSYLEDIKPDCTLEQKAIILKMQTDFGI